MVQRVFNKIDLNLALFFNGQRGLSVFNSLKDKVNIKCIFIAKKNLDNKNLKKIKKKFIIINSTNDPTIFKILKKEQINLIVSAGFPYIFGKNFFNKNKNIDILNLHGGPVPRYRGGSPLTWQKIEGRKNIGISVIKINRFIDSGKIMGVKFFQNNEKDNIKTIQNKANKIFSDLLWDVIKKNYLNVNIKISTKKLLPSKYYYQRKPEDSLINLEKTNLEKLCNFHKALVPLYNPPYLYYGDEKVHLKKIETTKQKSSNRKGFVEKKKNNFYLNLKDKKVKIIEASLNLKKIQNKFLASIKLERDTWLQNLYKKDCFITNNENYIKLFKNYKKSFIFLKTKKPIDKKNFLDLKIKFIGTNKLFFKDIENIKNYQKKDNIIYKTNPNDSEKKIIADIAYRNFRFSRFHLDDRLSNRFANLIKKKTLENHFLGNRGNKIIVQFYRRQISGFCLLKFENKEYALIDLISIDKKFSKKGLATDLMKYSTFMLNTKYGKNKLIVSTQEKNISAINLYKRFQFDTKNKYYLYHYIS